MEEPVGQMNMIDYSHYQLNQSHAKLQEEKQKVASQGSDNA